jgi:archaellum component FlaC
MYDFDKIMEFFREIEDRLAKLEFIENGRKPIEAKVPECFKGHVNRMWDSLYELITQHLDTRLQVLEKWRIEVDGKQNELRDMPKKLERLYAMNKLKERREMQEDKLGILSSKLITKYMQSDCYHPQMHGDRSDLEHFFDWFYEEGYEVTKQK